MTVLDNLHSTLLDFVDELLVIFPNDTYLTIAKVLLRDVKPQTVLDTFITNMLPYKEHVVNRNEHIIDCFVIPEPYSSHVKQLWKSTSQDDKDTIFDWLDTFIRFTEALTKLK